MKRKLRQSSYITSILLVFLVTLACAGNHSVRMTRNVTDKQVSTIIKLIQEKYNPEDLTEKGPGGEVMSQSPVCLPHVKISYDNRDLPETARYKFLSNPSLIDLPPPGTRG